MSPNASQDDAKMHKRIMQKFVDFLDDFLMTFGGFGRGWTLDLTCKGDTFVGSGLFDQDPKQHGK